MREVYPIRRRSHMELRLSAMVRLTTQRFTGAMARITNEETRMGTTLVLGGTGKTGRRIVRRLQAKGVPVRVGTLRHPAVRLDR